MSDLVGNPEDLFSQNEAHMSSDTDKSNIWLYLYRTWKQDNGLEFQTRKLATCIILSRLQMKKFDKVLLILVGTSIYILMFEAKVRNMSYLLI